MLAENPRCCFCGGAAASAEEDHIPPRSFFVSREWPEGFSFGACESCNKGTRQSELIAAYYMRWMDHEETSLVDADLQKLYEGMKNNHPELLPRTQLTAEEITHALSRVGDGFTHLSTGPAPLVAVPAGVNRHIKRFARKLACALHYKERGKILPREAFMWMNWTHYHDRVLPELMTALDDALPHFRTGTRSRRLLTSQFKYTFGIGEEGKLFAFLAQFGMSIVVVGATYDGVLSDKRMEDWQTLGALLNDDRETE